MKQIAIEKIRLDGGTQPRGEIDRETVATYVEGWSNGAEFPAVTVFFDGTDYWCADGFHRTLSAKEAGRDKIHVEIKQGTQRDAKLFSFGANDKHGKPRTNADKRRVVTEALTDEEWGKRSDRWIAEKCAVGHAFVSNMRKQLSTVDSSSPRTGKDGKARRQKAKSEKPRGGTPRAKTFDEDDGDGGTWHCNRCKTDRPYSDGVTCLNCFPEDANDAETAKSSDEPDEEELVLRARGEVDEVIRRHFRTLPRHRMRDLWMMIAKWEQLFAEKVRENERRAEEENHGGAASNDTAGAVRADADHEAHARRVAGQRH